MKKILLIILICVVAQFIGQNLLGADQITRAKARYSAHAGVAGFSLRKSSVIARSTADRQCDEAILQRLLRSLRSLAMTADNWLCPSVYAIDKGNPPVAHKGDAALSIDFSTMASSCNQDVSVFPVKDNSIISNLESIREMYVGSQPFCKGEGVRAGEIELYLFNNSSLDIFGKLQEFFFSKFCKVIADQASPAFFLTSLPEAMPDLRDFLSEARNSGLDASNSSSSSSSVCLSSTNPKVAPFLSTILTTRSKGKDNLNVLGLSNRTIISFNKGITIVLSPFDLMGKVYHSLENLSSRAYADTSGVAGESLRQDANSLARPFGRYSTRNGIHTGVAGFSLRSHDGVAGFSLREGTGADPITRAKARYYAHDEIHDGVANFSSRLTRILSDFFVTPAYAIDKGNPPVAQTLRNSSNSMLSEDFYESRYNIGKSFFGNFTYNLAYKPFVHTNDFAEFYNRRFREPAGFLVRTSQDKVKFAQLGCYMRRDSYDDDISARIIEFIRRDDNARSLFDSCKIGKWEWDKDNMALLIGYHRQNLQGYPRSQKNLQLTSEETYQYKKFSKAAAVLSGVFVVIPQGISESPVQPLLKMDSLSFTSIIKSTIPEYKCQALVKPRAKARYSTHDGVGAAHCAALCHAQQRLLPKGGLLIRPYIRAICDFFVTPAYAAEIAAPFRVRTAVTQAVVAGFSPRTLVTQAKACGYRVLNLVSDWLVPNVYAADKGNPPVAYWRFDEGSGSTAYDDTANNNDGTLTPGAGGSNTAAGQMWTRQGKIGGALECDGTDDYITVPAISGLTTLQTVSVWVYPKSFSVGMNYYVLDEGSNNHQIQLYDGDNNNGKPKIAFNSQLGTSELSNADQWYFITCVSETNGAIRIYINGILDATLSGTTPAPAGISIGRYGGGGYFFNGYIDDIRIYSYARTADQILVDYNAGSAAYLGAGTDPNEGNPAVGYWNFEKIGTDTNSIGYDKSGNNNNGTITGATQAAGKKGQALSFDGTDDRVSVGNIAAHNNIAYTVIAWVKASAQSDKRIYSESNTGLAQPFFGIGSGLATTSKARVFIRNNDNTTALDVETVNPVFDGSWHHIAWVDNNGSYTIYVDGNRDTANSYTKSSKTFNDANIGRHNVNSSPGSYLSGLIDDVKIYNYARTSAQITYDYNKGKPIAHYRFDDAGGAIAHNEYSLPFVAPHRYWRFIQTAVTTIHAPRTCELRWTDTLGNTRTPNSYTHGGTFSYSEDLWNISFDGATNTSDSGWITGNTGYIAADFGSPGVAMMKFEAYGSYTGSARGATWDIQYSDDNSIWVTIKTWNFTTTDNGGGLGAGNYAGWYGTTWHTHGTLVGDTKFVDGKIGKALYFDGTGDYVSVANPSSFNFGTADFTIEAWIKRNVTGAQNDILEKSDGGTWSSNGKQFTVASNNLLYFGVYGIGDVHSTSVIPANEWHHVAVTFNDSSDSVKLYIDGVNDVSGTLALDVDNAAHTISVGGRTDFFNGLIDDVRIYNYARSADQVLQDYNAGASRLGAQAAGVADPWGGALPIAHWKMDENTGVLVRDASGNGKDGTITSAAWIQGKNGSALQFNVSGAVVNGSDSGFPSGTSARTMEAWVKPFSVPSVEGVIMYYGTAAANQTWGLYLSSGGIFGATQWGAAVAGDSLPLNQWSHVAVTYDGTTYKLYRNGAFLNSGTMTTNTALGQFRIGNHFPAYDRPFPGIIDDVRIYNYARSAAQIAWDYNTGKPVGHWRFDEGSGTTAYDDSDNNNDGTITIGGTGSQTTIGTAWTNGATGKFGKCMSFDGTDDYVNVASSSSLNSGQVTVSAWFKQTAYPASQGSIIVKAYTSATAPHYQFNIMTLKNGGGYTGQIYVGGIINGSWVETQGSGTGLGSQPTVTNNVWHHIAMTYDGSVLKQYYDGVVTAYANVSGSINTYSTNLNIGRNATYSTDYFIGLIDDVRVYNYARTPLQILEDYNQGLATKLGD